VSRNRTRDVNVQDDFEYVRRKFNSDDLRLYIPGTSARKRVGLLVSKQDHCVVRVPPLCIPGTSCW
jgi:formyltetrahydrofolate hydrolase